MMISAHHVGDPASVADAVTAVVLAVRYAVVRYWVDPLCPDVSCVNDPSALGVPPPLLLLMTKYARSPVTTGVPEVTDTAVDAVGPAEAVAGSTAWMDAM